MTSGVIRFDYIASVTGAPGVIVGDTARRNDLVPGQELKYSYQNNSDTIQSVFYAITPKVAGLGCNQEMLLHLKSKYIQYHSKIADKYRCHYTIDLYRRSRSGIIESYYFKRSKSISYCMVWSDYISYAGLSRYN